MCLQMLMTGDKIKTILGLILAIGNYMNGGTSRGQADGFGLEILAKLKDVKSKDNSQNLLQYVVARYVRTYDCCVETPQGGATVIPAGGPGGGGAEKMPCPVPEPADVSKAGLINFDDVEQEIRKLRENVDGRWRPS